MSSRPLRSCRLSDQVPESVMEWEEEEEDVPRRKRAAETSQKKPTTTRKFPASPLKKSQRVNKSTANYHEASSDDEFAKTHFMLESSDEEEMETLCSSKKCSKSSKGKSATPKQVVSESIESEEEENSEEIEYRIQYILGKKSMPQSQWREMNENYTTIEVTKGSVWQQPDEEYYDDSPVPVEKFLIKWMHASFLHITWETEKDLMDMVGQTAKQHIKKFRMRELEGRELFEDLSKGEFVPPSYFQVERILDVDDPEVDMYKVDWETAMMPESVSKKEKTLVSMPESGSEPMDTVESSLANTDTEQITDELASKADVEEEEEEIIVRRSSRRVAKRASSVEDEEEVEAPQVVTKTFGKSGRSKKQKLCQYLHGSNCWVTVKWEGLPYSDVSFENLNDLISRGVEYEPQLRAFYRREQRCLSEPPMNKKAARKLILDQTIIGSNSTAPTFPGGTLRDYQWEGVRWMLFNLVQGRNCILADEMGLGKTIQSSTLLHMVKKHQASAGPFLVVAPLSTIVNWQREIAAWTNLDSILYYGSQEDRELIRSYEFKYLNAGSSKANKSNNSNGYKIEVVITTPETCVAFDDKNGSKRELSKILWDMVIVDEAHKLKNYDSKLSSTLRDEYNFKNCVLLTGTPLQNNTDELWTLLNFVANEDFADREAFIEQFGELKSSSQLEALHKRIKPYLLRREKENVEKGVPPKEEVIIEVELTVPQKQYYRAIYEQKTGFLYKSGTKDGPSLSNLAMELRKCCNHPFLIKGAATEISNHFVNDSPHDVLVKSSGKMTLLDKLLPKLQKDGHRVLIFSQFRMMLDLIEDYLHSMGYLYERVDGSVVGKKRQAAIDRYSQNENLFVMLLSTKAGGVGINLTAADTVIIYDSDWNPQNDIQAQARAHRIGQTRAVTVYRLLTKKTYEMVMFRAASIKLGLDYAVMHNLDSTVNLQNVPNTGSRRRGKKMAALEGISNEKAEHVSSLSKKELETLLKHGAYDMFIEEKEGISEKESSKFVEESIEQILERSAVIIHKDEKESPEDDSTPNEENDSSAVVSTKSKGPKGCSFAKASFVSAAETSGENNEVAIDDPEFWTKVIGIAIEEEGTSVGAKRKCRQLVENYKEPTDSIRSIYGNISNAYASDSEDSAVSNQEAKRKRRKKDEVVPAEYTADNILAVISAVIALGFTNWQQVKKLSKLRWTLGDIQKAAKLGMLYILLASSVSLSEDKEANASASSENIAVGTANDGSIDYAFLYHAVRKYKLSKVLLKRFSDSQSKDVVVGFEEEESMLTTVLQSLLDAFPADDEAMTTTKYKEIFDQTFLPKPFDGSFESKLEEIKSFVDDLNSLPEIQALRSSETDSEKQQKRVLNYRSKLAQVEDLFEALVFCNLSNMVNPQKEAEINVDEAETPMELPAENNENVTEVEAAAELEEGNKEGQPNVNVTYAKPNIFMCAKLDGLLQDNFVDSKEKDKLPSWWCRSYDSALLHAVVNNGWPEGKRRLAGAIGTLVQLSPADGSVVVMSEMVTPKFIMQRFKTLTRSLRYSEEDVAAAAKAVAAAKASLKIQMKKNIILILKLVQRNGYPRSAYDSIAASLMSKIENNEERANRLAYLYTWQTLAKECNMEGSEDEVKNVVHAALEFFNNEVDGYTGETISSGLLEDIPVKLIKPAFEKSDIIHHIRLTLAINSEPEIKEYVTENCKGTGPNVPGFKRDMTMPVWWTLDHDVSLLKLCLIHGYGSWKPITVDPIVSNAPEDFVMPPKVNGVEWVIQLTTRNAEKRVLALLRGMPQIKALALPAPSSPQKKGQGVQQVAPMPSVNKSIFWFQQQKATSSSSKSSGKNEKDNNCEASPETNITRTISQSSAVSSSEGNIAIDEVECIEKKEIVYLQEPSVSAPETTFSKKVENTPVEKLSAEEYVNNMNAIRSDSPVNLIVIDEEEPFKPEVETVSKGVESPKPVDKPVVVIDTEVEEKTAATPTKECVVLVKTASIESSEGNVKTTMQTPQVQSAASAPALEKKGKKAEKASVKNAPVPASKSILSFFKKV